MKNPLRKLGRFLGVVPPEPSYRPRRFEFAISVYTGASPFELKPCPGENLPLLTWRDAHDVAASFVADPFLIKIDHRWYMFFEVFNRERKKGEIAVATSRDGFAWQYLQVVLTESFHLSYPFVFESAGELYMVPESYEAGGVRLYRASRFPTEWTYVRTLLEGVYLTDATLLCLENSWWMFVETNPEIRLDTLRLFSAKELAAPWQEHPRSPIVRGNNRTARPAGRMLRHNGSLYRFAQDCHPNYGTHVRAFEINELSAIHYAEKEIEQSPILRASGSGWNATGMHHVDAHEIESGQWLAAVDGWRWLDD